MIATERKNEVARQVDLGRRMAWSLPRTLEVAMLYYLIPLFGWVVLASLMTMIVVGGNRRPTPQITHLTDEAIRSGRVTTSRDQASAPSWVIVPVGDHRPRMHRRRVDRPATLRYREA